MNLTRREREVAQFILLGLTDKEIARRLSIGARSVEYFRERACVKLGVQGRLGIVRKLLETTDVQGEHGGI
jgi:DNA-binding CsgD family transcriptional regulator